MSFRTFLGILLLVSIPLSGQSPVPDTLRKGSSVVKMAGDYVYETTVDSVLTIVINEILARNSGFNYDQAGDDDDWFEIYNFGDDPVNLTQLCFTDDLADPLKWSMDDAEDIYLKPGEFYLLWADGEPGEGINHTNFKLSGDGESLSVFSKKGELIDQRTYPSQTVNISFGRYPDGATEWAYFDEPTPMEANDSTPGSGVLPLPLTNLPGGIYNQPQSLHLYSVIPDADIRYTTDCSLPDINSKKLSGLLAIDSTVIIRARIMKEGHLDGPVLTLSFLMGIHATDNPVVSVVSEPQLLYGINGLLTTNSSTMEIPANFEFIKASASLINTGAGMQLHSVKSTKPDSFRMYARSRYGNDWFGYPFFDDRGPSVFKRLIFRNSGNDNVNKKSTNCHFRDPLAEEIALISNKNGMVSASRPVNVYLNGKYYGVFNLRERIDEYFIETHTGIDEDYDLLERSFGYPKNRNAIVGSFEKWDQLLSFVDTTGDMTKQDDYNYVKSQVDIVNFTDYWITEVFLGNYDWLSNNIKFWKPEDGKWQWIYWDLDHSLGLIYGSYGDPAWNTLQWSLTFSDRAWPNGYNNILIRGLLKNQEYRDYFIKRFTCLLNTNYTDKQTVPIFESFVDIYENDLPMHMDRWNRNISDWENANTILADYLQKRPGYVFGHLQSFFGLDNPVNVSLRFEPPGSGYLFFNDTEKTGDLLEGKYFPGMKYPVSFEVHDDLSLYRFMVNNKSFSSDSILLTEDTEIRVNFLREDATIPVQISEIYFNNREEYDCGDWIEFYYYGFDTLDLSGAELRADDSHILFSFPQGTNIPPSSYFVLAEDEQMFSKIYTDDFIYLNGLTDEMDEMDEMTLISGNGQVLKTMDLGELQEMTMAPGQGYSLEMNRLGLDQDQKINWSLSGDSYGSPGLSNDSTWNFHRPAGKDRYFRIEDEVLIEFASSDFYYSDQDNHRMAGFYVKDILGHATFQHDNIILEKDHFYEPMDFWYIPSQNSNSATRLTYTFIDQSGQSSEINTLTFSYVSQRTEETEATFRIYPNPASDFLYIEGVPDPENIRQYTITDLTGRTIKSGSIDQYKEMFSIEINGLPAGIYFLGIRCSGAVYENKFIINR